MRYSQYLRLERLAGGVGASNKDFIKACHSVLKNKYSLVERDSRHKWIREGLDYLNKSKQRFIDWRLWNVYNR